MAEHSCTYGACKCACPLAAKITHPTGHSVPPGTMFKKYDDTVEVAFDTVSARHDVAIGVMLGVRTSGLGASMGAGSGQVLEGMPFPTIA